jgi:hypothetical protein
MGDMVPPPIKRLKAVLVHRALMKYYTRAIAR